MTLPTFQCQQNYQDEASAQRLEDRRTVEAGYNGITRSETSPWRTMLLEEQRHVHQADQHRHLDQWTDDGGEGDPELMPKTATATAIANSKLLLAAVNAIVAVLE